MCVCVSKKVTNVPGLRAKLAIQRNVADYTAEVFSVQSRHPAAGMWRKYQSQLQAKRGENRENKHDSVNKTKTHLLINGL